MPQGPGDITTNDQPEVTGSTTDGPPPIHETVTPNSDLKAEQEPEVTVAEASKVSITLLLVSGRRRTQEFDRKTTIGELKEMVWSTWPSEWSDELPPSASFLRILYLGRILTDDTILSSLNLAEPPESTVVHISVRSFAPASDEDDNLKKKQKKRASRRGRSGTTDNAGGADNTGSGAAARVAADAEDEGRGGCCGCVIC